MGSHVLSLVDQPTHFTWYWVTPFDSRPATTLDRLRLVRVLASSRVGVRLVLVVPCALGAAGTAFAFFAAVAALVAPPGWGPRFPIV